MAKTKKVGRWYFGGLASAGAACCTHPLDLLKVHLQTQSQGNIGLLKMGVKVVKNDGIFGLYNGLSASLLRQLTYSMTRFAIYETVKGKISDSEHPMPFYQKVLLGAGAGCIGGFVGTPGDMVNVRMQNDMKLPAAERRNYKHALDGLLRVAREEGPKKLMSGATMASSRATLVTVGQLSFYDQFKQILLALPMFEDNMITHFSASFMAGAVATLITMPLDVMKTRVMNAPPGKYAGGVATLITMPVDVMKTRLMSAPAGKYRGLGDCAKDIARAGPMGFFKGFIPAFVRLGPQTILTFMLFEQLRLNFGAEVTEEE